MRPTVPAEPTTGAECPLCGGQLGGVRVRWPQSYPDWEAGICICQECYVRTAASALAHHGLLTSRDPNMLWHLGQVAQYEAWAQEDARKAPPST